MTSHRGAGTCTVPYKHYDVPFVSDVHVYLIKAVMPSFPRLKATSHFVT